MVDVDRVDALGPQGVALQVQRLGAVGLLDAGVADQHVSQTVVWNMRAWRLPGERSRCSCACSATRPACWLPERVRSGGRRGFIGRQLDLDGDELADYAVRFGEDQSDLAKACATLAEFNAWHAAPSPDGRSMVADTIHPDVGPQLFPVKAGRPAFTVCASGPSSIEADPCASRTGWWTHGLPPSRGNGDRRVSGVRVRAAAWAEPARQMPRSEPRRRLAETFRCRRRRRRGRYWSPSAAARRTRREAGRTCGSRRRRRPRPPDVAGRHEPGAPTGRVVPLSPQMGGDAVRGSG